MKRLRSLLIVGMALCASLYAPFATALVIGQSDTFENGTTQNWVVGLLGAPHPAPPTNVADGGPLGAGDNFLRLSSLSGSGSSPGNRLTVLNLSQWAGNYATSGISEIAMDLINLGPSDLFIRLYLENPQGAPPVDQAITDAAFLPAGGGWTSTRFSIRSSDLIALTGDLDTLLSNVTVLRIIHGPDEAFPGPSISAILGVDNITAADGNAIPEPSTLALLAFGLIALRFQKRKQS